VIKLLIAGSRNFTDLALLTEEVDSFLSDYRYPDEEVEIVSGGARGADRLGERYAKGKGFPVKLFLPDWDSEGKSAGVIRNGQMSNYATHAVIFWDGVSKGTADMVKRCKFKRIITKVVKFDNTQKDCF